MPDEAAKEVDQAGGCATDAHLTLGELRLGRVVGSRRRQRVERHRGN